MRKSKKQLLSMALASAMATSLLPVTAFAADPATPTNGGTVNVSVGQISPLIRVAVPTKLYVAVDQFEFASKGSQIYSEGFKMENKGESAVNVNVNTTATLDSKVKLVDTRDGALNADEMWLGTVAAIDAGKYVADATDDDAKLGTLNEKSENVSTFSKGDQKNTVQDFYLDKSTVGATDYNLLEIGAGEDALTAAKASVKDSYIEAYEVNYSSDVPAAPEEVQEDVEGYEDLETPTPEQKAQHQAFLDYTEIISARAAKLTDLNDKLVANDVYYKVEDGTLTKLNKGSAAQTELPEGIVSYYTAATTGTKVSAFQNSKKYIYIDGKNNDENKAKAEFKFIGQLSDATDVWTNDLVQSLAINYTIKPVSATNYDEMEEDLTYGYCPSAAPTISAKESTGVTLGTGVINLVKGNNLSIETTLGIGKAAATDITSVTFMKGDTPVSLTKDTDYTIADGTITLKAASTNLKAIIGSSVTKAVAASSNYRVKVVFNDKATTTLTTDPIAVNLQ